MKFEYFVFGIVLVGWIVDFLRGRKSDSEQTTQAEQERMEAIEEELRRMLEMDKDESNSTISTEEARRSGKLPEKAPADIMYDRTSAIPDEASSSGAVYTESSHTSDASRTSQTQQRADELAYETWESKESKRASKSTDAEMREIKDSDYLSSERCLSKKPSDENCTSRAKGISGSFDRRARDSDGSVQNDLAVAAREGVKWSIILGEPKGYRYMPNYRRNGTF